MVLIQDLCCQGQRQAVPAVQQWAHDIGGHDAGVKYIPDYACRLLQPNSIVNSERVSLERRPCGR